MMSSAKRMGLYRCACRLARSPLDRQQMIKRKEQHFV